MNVQKRIVVGVSGASSVTLALQVLKALKEFPKVETHLVMTHGAVRALQMESGLAADAFFQKADVVHESDELGASIASGSFRTAGMIVVPCSMKTVAGIASGFSDNLLLRAADVTIKEQRPLILAPREAPLSPIHLENLLKLLRIPGVKIVPPLVNNYQRVGSVSELERQIALKLVGYLGFDSDELIRWNPSAI